MTVKTVIKTSLVAGISLVMVAGSVAPAFAQSVGVSASVTTGGGAAALQNVITTANTNIAARITALQGLNTRVQAMVNESATEKASISSNVQTNISGLQALQTKIDADTTAPTAHSDAATIFTTFRIYALVMPQGYILSAADRVSVITGLMTSLQAKIQARITADQTAGDNVASLTAALTDMSTQITNANAQAASAQSGVAGLQPDQGNTTVAASNKAALVAAHGDIKTAASDLKAARADVATILSGLKSLGTRASSST